METGAKTSSASSDERETPAPTEQSPSALHQFWQKEKTAADKRLRDFRRRGNLVVSRYLDERGGAAGGSNAGSNGSTEFRLNLFHTYVSTMQSMLYGSVPKVDVSREHQDPDDDIARVASVILQRILEADVQQSGADVPTTLRACLQDRLLPGMGTARIHYDYRTEELDTIDPTTQETKKAQHLTGEWCESRYVHWQDFMWGWARTWTEVPWVGYRIWLTKDEATERWGKKKADALTYVNQLPTGKSGDSEDRNEDTAQRNNTQKAEVWEFWSKKDRRLYWWSEGADLILDSIADPLNLDGFFPGPPPMMANLTTTKFVPTADFALAQDLYNEIDELSTRIAMITRAVKVVGVYDKSAGDSVGRMFREGTENDLIPVDSWAAFAEKGGLKGCLEWLPVQEIASTLKTLNEVRDESINLLYQVTGMSDILRGGSTDQYTSDGTQQLKAKFGSIRVQALQDQFAVFASELSAIKAEVIAKHFDERSILVQSGAQFLPKADMQKVIPAVQLIKSPEIKWRVNIRPESIAMMDYAQLKSERTEFLTAMATYVQSAQAAAKTIPGSLPLLLELMKWGMAGFKGSDYLEGTMDRAIEDLTKNPPKDQDDGNQQAEKMKFQNAMQLEQTKHQNAMQSMQAKSQADLQKTHADMQTKMELLFADLKADLQLVEANKNADLQVEGAQAQGDTIANQVEHENTMVEMETQHNMDMVEIAADHTTTMAEKKKDGEMAADDKSGNGE